MVTSWRILQRLLTFLPLLMQRSKSNSILPAHRYKYKSICTRSVLCARPGGVVVCDLGSIFCLVCGWTWILGKKKLRPRLLLGMYGWGEDLFVDMRERLARGIWKGPGWTRSWEERVGQSERGREGREERGGPRDQETKRTKMAGLQREAGGRGVSSVGIERDPSQSQLCYVK